MQFDPPLFKLGPGQEKVVTAIYTSESPETLEQLVECITFKGERQYILARAEIQDSYVTLNKFSLDFDSLYKGNTYILEKGKTEQYIEI